MLRAWGYSGVWRVSEDGGRRTTTATGNRKLAALLALLPASFKTRNWGGRAQNRGKHFCAQNVKGMFKSMWAEIAEILLPSAARFCSP